MTETADAALRDTIDHAAIDYHNEDYERCLRRCAALLVGKDQPLDERMKRGLYTFMGECCSKLAEQNSGAPSGQHACSFCGRSPPDVRLGAGPSAFICNGCVETFGNLLADQPTR